MSFCFGSYSIRKLTDNSEADYEELDSQIREQFSLRGDNTDYGHFFFTEPDEELEGFQSSISWTGLIHVVLYYSKIGYGKSTIYDVEAAMAWVREYAIHIPDSAAIFLSELIIFLHQKGFYIFVNYTT